MVIEKRWAASCFFSFSPKSPFLLDPSQSCVGNVWYIFCVVTTNETGTGWMTMRTVATLRSASPEKRFPTSMPSRWACLTHIQHTSCPIGIWREKFLNTEDDENHFPLFRKSGISASMEAEMNWKVSRCKSETTLQWTRRTAYWCEPMIRFPMCAVATSVPNSPNVTANIDNQLV